MTQPKAQSAVDELKPCPLPQCCGTPKIEPSNPELEGSAWGQITCEHLEFSSELNGGSIRYLTQISVHCDEAPLEKVKAAWNTRTPDLSRILKLAAAAREYFKATQTREGAYFEEGTLMDIEAAGLDLTSEDCQLLEAVLKE